MMAAISKREYDAKVKQLIADKPGHNARWYAQQMLDQGYTCEGEERDIVIDWHTTRCKQVARAAKMAGFTEAIISVKEPDAEGGEQDAYLFAKDATPEQAQRYLDQTSSSANALIQRGLAMMSKWREAPYGYQLTFLFGD